MSGFKSKMVGIRCERRIQTDATLRECPFRAEVCVEKTMVRERDTAREGDEYTGVTLVARPGRNRLGSEWNAGSQRGPRRPWVVKIDLRAVVWRELGARDIWEVQCEETLAQQLIQQSTRRVASPPRDTLIRTTCPSPAMHRTYAIPDPTTYAIPAPRALPTVYRGRSARRKRSSLELRAFPSPPHSDTSDAARRPGDEARLDAERRDAQDVPCRAETPDAAPLSHRAQRRRARHRGRIAGDPSGSGENERGPYDRGHRGPASWRVHLVILSVPTARIRSVVPAELDRLREACDHLYERRGA
ncbi:hypothetical protein DFH09DRAFT_1098474 [Mycena vulgaris]|nr:hypothetical protein DFH09DRAFT_1098474 [Mycena vulgaris]